ncbi:MAG: helix-turn-helix domain-containing protein [Candidatus Delongbacteria bacterium]|jgi:AraC-like DNA-binding protein|nr:helix-turn-helix domain-containing protein [Candidatus Delongbacteria bacterium]
MEILYLIPAVQALYSAVTLPFNKRTNLHITWLFMALLSVAGYFSTMYINAVFITDIDLKILAASFLLFTGPFLYLHVTSYIKHYGKPYYLAHILIVIAVISGSVIIYPVKPAIFMFGINVIMLLYVVWIAMLHKAYYKAVKNTWPVPEKFIRQWLPVLIVVFGGFSVLMIGASWLVRINNDIGIDMFAVIAGGAAAGLFYSGYLALRKLDQLLVSPDVDDDDGLVSGLTPESLHEFMMESKAYRDNLLSIHSFAQMMDIDEAQLSVVLNKKMHKNFAAFVNEYRINEVKSRLQSGDTNEYTLLAIAFDSGFNSKATFNRVFKLYTGKTPRQYAHQQ